MNSVAKGETFDVRQWRNAVAQFDWVDLNASAVSAFGFEFTGDRRFLDQLPLRYYVYITAPDIVLPAERWRIAVSLLDHLKTSQPAVAKSIGCLVTASNRSIVSPGPGSLYLTFLEEVPGATDALDEYCMAILASPFLAASGRLSEMEAFQSKPTARRFVFQLGVVWSYCFSSSGGAVTQDEQSLLRTLAAVRGSCGPGGEALASPPSPHEREVLRAVVDRQAASIVASYAGRPTSTVWTHQLATGLSTQVLLPESLLGLQQVMRVSFTSYGSSREVL